jgi:hypothetical protein
VVGPRDVVIAPHLVSARLPAREQARGCVAHLTAPPTMYGRTSLGLFSCFLRLQQVNRSQAAEW